MEEEQLVRALKAGSEEAMKVVIKNYGGLVKYIVIKVLGTQTQEDVEECIADVFVELWTGLKHYDAKRGSLKNYIVGIARYKALDAYKKLSKDTKGKLPLEEDELCIHMEGTETIVLKQLESNIINQVIDEMEEPDRSIFIRRYFWFEKVKEIAVALNVNTKFVENKLHRNKKKLKDAFSERGVRL